MTDDFGQFVGARVADLRRIARATRGEYAYDDVVNEAWLIARGLAVRAGGLLPDFLDSGFQDLLIRHLYQALVRYTETHVRHAVRLDRPLRGEHGQEVHSLLDCLPSNVSDEPSNHVQAEEELLEQAAREKMLAGSPAFAWLTLLRANDHSMRRVAGFLLISPSHAYRCCAKVRAAATRQTAIAMTSRRLRSQLGPWRRFRTIRTPRQLEFDFSENRFFGLAASYT